MWGYCQSTYTVGTSKFPLPSGSKNSLSSQRHASVSLVLQVPCVMSQWLRGDHLAK